MICYAAVKNLTQKGSTVLILQQAGPLVSALSFQNHGPFTSFPNHSCYLMGHLKPWVQGEAASVHR